IIFLGFVTPNDPNFKKMDSADAVFSYGLYVEFYPLFNNSVDKDMFVTALRQLKSPFNVGGEVNWDVVNAQKYDGINDWPV
ncbi:unnamed protein product, partial [marine sediment metagenome]